MYLKKCIVKYRNESVYINYFLLSNHNTLCIKVAERYTPPTLISFTTHNINIPLIFMFSESIYLPVIKLLLKQELPLWWRLKMLQKLSYEYLELLKIFIHFKFGRFNGQPNALIESIIYIWNSTSSLLHSCNFYN